MEEGIAESDEVRINVAIRGEPAKILQILKKRGIVTSMTDAVVQGTWALYEKVVERDIKAAQLKNETA